MKNNYLKKTSMLIALGAFLGFSINAQPNPNQMPIPKQVPKTAPKTEQTPKMDEKKKPAPARGRFRVVLNGFVASSQTWDNAGQWDGKDDEVYIESNVRVIDRDGRELQVPSSDRSQVMGDRNGYGYRIKAGSASDLGGIRSGDMFPSNTPWARRSAAADRDRLPMVLWEGDLIAGQNAVVIIPTIWEWDGGEDMFTGWRRTIAANGAPIAGTAVTFISGPAAGAAVAAGLQVALPAASNFLGDVIGVAGDRPIGTVKNGSDWRFDPKILAMTYEIAQNTIANDSGKGRGIVGVEYRDAPELRGNYTLYIQVERLSDAPAPGE